MLFVKKSIGWFFFGAALIVLIPIGILLKLKWYFWGGGPQPPSQDSVDTYNDVTQAMQDADIDALEAFTRSVESFPLGSDPFVNTPWLNHAFDYGNHLAVITWLIEQGCDVNFEDDCGNWPLDNACEQQPFNAEVAQALIDAGADIDHGDCLGFTSLHHVAMRGHLDVLKWLLANGADTTKAQWDYHGSDPLAIDMARKYSQKEAYAILERAMASSN